MTPEDRDSFRSSLGGPPIALAGRDGNGAARSFGDLAYEPQRARKERVVASRETIGRRLANIWGARDLLVFLVRKEVKVRYKDSALGFLWSMLNPALMLTVYYFVFKAIGRGGIPHFALFLFTGIIPWNLYLSGLLGATGSVVGNGGLVKKVSFPREILPLSTVGSALVFFFFQCIVLALALGIFGFQPAFAYLPLLVLALITLLVFTGAFGMLLSALNVYLRDVQHLVEVALMAWFWSIPIVYSFQTMAPHLSKYHLTWLYLANPVTPVVLTFQRALYAHVYYPAVAAAPASHGKPAVAARAAMQVLPAHGWDWYLFILLGLLAASLLLFLIAMVVFGRVEGNFAEEL
ncbi:MAG: ABC transporter permease [Actinomycetota bacterium]|nr:ABC transporter permease [Actinomycetota bacterium]